LRIEAELLDLGASGDIPVEEGDDGFPVARLGRQQHRLLLDAADHCRLKVNDDDELLPDHLFRRIGVGDPGDHRPFEDRKFVFLLPRRNEYSWSNFATPHHRR